MYIQKATTQSRKILLFVSLGINNM